MGEDEPAKVISRGVRDLHARRWLEVVEGNRLSSPGLPTAELCSLPCTVDPVEDGDDACRIRMASSMALDSRERALVDVHTGGETGELGRLRFVEGDVEPLRTRGQSVRGSTRIV